MNSEDEVLVVENVIESDEEEIYNKSNALWTEQALDMFISQLQSASELTFVNESEMLRYVMKKMSSRNFIFTLDQIEYKYNGLKQVYKDRKQRNHEIEPELVKLFGGVKELQPMSVKNFKTENPPNTSEINNEEPQTNKLVWTNESNKLFLDLLEEHRPMLGTVFKTKKQMWKEISKRLNMQGYFQTWYQVENKWKYFVKHYRDRLSPRKFEKSKKRYCNGKRASLQLKKKQVKDIISFANDQTLPFEYTDDDENDNDDREQFEETCSMSGVNYVDETNDNYDPVFVEERKILPDNDISLSGTSAKQLEQISEEVSSLRQDLLQHQSKVIAIQRKQLEISIRQEEHFTRIDNTLNELLQYLKRRDGDL